MKKKDERVIHIMSNYLYMEEFFIKDDFEIEIKITNRKEKAKHYLSTDVPKMLKTLEDVCRFTNVFAEDPNEDE